MSPTRERGPRWRVGLICSGILHADIATLIRDELRGKLGIPSHLPRGAAPGGPVKAPRRRAAWSGGPGLLWPPVSRAQRRILWPEPPTFVEPPVKQPFPAPGSLAG